MSRSSRQGGRSRSSKPWDEDSDATSESDSESDKTTSITQSVDIQSLSREELRMLRMIEAYEKSHRKKEEAAAKKLARAEAAKRKRQEAKAQKQKQHASASQTPNTDEPPGQSPPYELIPTTIAADAPPATDQPQARGKTKGRKPAQKPQSRQQQQEHEPQNYPHGSNAQEQSQHQQNNKRKQGKSQPAQLDLYMSQADVHAHQQRFFAAKRRCYIQRTPGMLPPNHQIVNLYANPPVVIPPPQSWLTK